MRGFRDTMQEGGRTAVLDGVALPFGPDAVLWNPSPEQEAVLTKDAGRQARFEPVEEMGKSPVEGEYATGAALFGDGGDE